MRCSASEERRSPWRATNSKRRRASSGSTSSLWGARKWMRSRCTLNSALETRERKSRNCAKKPAGLASPASSAADGGAVNVAGVAVVFAHPLRRARQAPVFGQPILGVEGELVIVAAGLDVQVTAQAGKEVVGSRNSGVGSAAPSRNWPSQHTNWKSRRAAGGILKSFGSRW